MLDLYTCTIITLEQKLRLGSLPPLAALAPSECRAGPAVGECLGHVFKVPLGTVNGDRRKVKHIEGISQHVGRGDTWIGVRLVPVFKPKVTFWGLLNLQKRVGAMSAMVTVSLIVLVFVCYSFL